MADRSALVIGAGGLGSPVALALAAAGVRLTIVDDDAVSLDNLQRQLLFRTADVGRPKAAAAAARLLELSPSLPVTALRLRLSAGSAASLVAAADVVVDGSDNFPTRFLANDACVLAGKPLVHGGVLGFRGQLLTVHPGRGACYRCLFEEAPPPGSVPSCSEAGVLGALCGVIGALMARAALGALAGEAGRAGELTIWEALRGAPRTIRVERDPRCAACGELPTITALVAARYSPPPGCEVAS